MLKLTKQIKMVFVIIILIILIFIFQFFSKPKIDTNSYVTLISGEATLNNHPLLIKKKEILKQNDTLETGNSGSLAIIEWGEGSITRVGPNTKLVIDKANISQDLTNIEIFFKLIGDSGKTWSQVVSFIGEESYFKQGFADTEAAVRGTTFEVNLDNNYIYVEKHEVSLKNSKNNKVYTITEKRPFDIKIFDFVALEKFIISLRDKTWQELNKKLDKEILKKLKENIKQTLENTKKLVNLKNIDLDNLSQLDKQKLYKELLSSYQNIKPSTITPKDRELYKYKLQYQEILTSLASEQDKKNLLRTSVYDLKEAIKLENFDDFKSIMEYIGKNKDFINFKDFDNVINFSGIKNSLKNGIIDFIRNTKQGNINDFLGDSFNSFEKLNLKNSFNNITNKTKQIKENLPGLDNLKGIGNNIEGSLNNLSDKLFNN